MKVVDQYVASLNPVPRPPVVSPAEVDRVATDARRGHTDYRAWAIAEQGATTAEQSQAVPTRARHAKRVGHRVRTVWIVAAVIAAAIPIVTVVLPDGAATSAQAEPIRVLRQAADSSSATKTPVPRDDQFVYVHGGSYQAWLSVDGTHDGLVRNPGDAPIPGCRNGVVLAAGNYVGVKEVPCAPDPAFLPDVPVDLDALNAWLVARATGPNEKRDPADPSGVNAVAKTVLDLLSQHYVSPAARGALFDVIAQYPGLSMTTTGVPVGDVGVGWSFGGGSTTLVFDRSTHSFVGTATEMYGQVEITTMTIVDHVGDTS